jgi:type III restriction enzyme
MALHPDFPTSPHAILDPAIRWFPADEAMRDTTQVATLAAGPLR